MHHDLRNLPYGAPSGNAGDGGVPSVVLLPTLATSTMSASPLPTTTMPQRAGMTCKVRINAVRDELSRSVTTPSSRDRS